jgi:drug/metabolite transporter (DMT)-like permease
MDYSAFAWATLWGWLVFDHLPPASTWIGAPIVIAAGLIIAWREHLLHRHARATR